MLFQKISIPLPWKVFFFLIELPTPSEIPFLCHTFIQKIRLLKPPSPLEFPLTFHGVGTDIFWNCTLEVMRIICFHSIFVPECEGDALWRLRISWLEYMYDSRDGNYGLRCHTLFFYITMLPLQTTLEIA